MGKVVNEKVIEFPDGEAIKAIPWKGELACHDCGAICGQYHEDGCDMERCPRCGNQLISCGCMWTEEERASSWSFLEDWKKCPEAVSHVYGKNRRVNNG